MRIESRNRYYPLFGGGDDPYGRGWVERYIRVPTSSLTPPDVPLLREIWNEKPVRFACTPVPNIKEWLAYFFFGSHPSERKLSFFVRSGEFHAADHGVWYKGKPLNHLAYGSPILIDEVPPKDSEARFREMEEGISRKHSRKSSVSSSSKEASPSKRRCSSRREVLSHPLLEVVDEDAPPPPSVTMEFDVRAEGVNVGAESSRAAEVRLNPARQIQITIPAGVDVMSFPARVFGQMASLLGEQEKAHFAGKLFEESLQISYELMVKSQLAGLDALLKIGPFWEEVNQLKDAYIELQVRIAQLESENQALIFNGQTLQANVERLQKEAAELESQCRTWSESFRKLGNKTLELQEDLQLKFVELELKVNELKIAHDTFDEFTQSIVGLTSSRVALEAEVHELNVQLTNVKKLHQESDDFIIDQDERMSLVKNYECFASEVRTLESIANSKGINLSTEIAIARDEFIRAKNLLNFFDKLDGAEEDSEEGLSAPEDDDEEEN